MTMMILGTVATTKGHVQHVDPAGDVDVWNLPATSYETTQRRVPLLVGHDAGFRIGTVVYYERSRVDGLLAVAQADDSFLEFLDDGDAWYFSPAVASVACGPLERNHGRIHELSMVRSTATVNACPVRWSLPPSMPARCAGPSGSHRAGCRHAGTRRGIERPRRSPTTGTRTAGTMRCASTTSIHSASSTKCSAIPTLQHE
jgi:hypothetical protein